MNCDQCEALMINGVFSHERGCPNAKKVWDGDAERWIATRKCFHCGCTVYEDDPCCDGEGNT